MVETELRATIPLHDDVSSSSPPNELNIDSQGSSSSGNNSDVESTVPPPPPSVAAASEPIGSRKRRFRPLHPLPDLSVSSSLSSSTSSLATSDLGFSSQSSTASSTAVSSYSSSSLDAVSRSSLSSYRTRDEDLQTAFMKRGRYEGDLDENDGFLSSEFASNDSSLSPGSTPARILVGGRNEKEKLEFLINDSRIGDYHIIGAGKEAKAVHIPTNDVYNCQVLTHKEVVTVTKVIYRLDDAELTYKGSDTEELKELIFPKSCELVEEMTGRVLLFTPTDDGNLNSFCISKAEKMAESDIQPAFKQIVRILAFCHKIGIVIRDFKPKNFVFDKKSKELRLSTVTECIVLDDPNNDNIKERFGMPAYVPPEVITTKSCGHAAKPGEIWSLGVLTYYMLIGRYPFYGKTPREIFEMIKKARLTFPNDIQLSRGARVLLHGLLRREPEERPTASELLAMPIWPEPCTTPCRVPRIAPLFTLPPEQLRIRLDQITRRNNANYDTTQNLRSLRDAVTQMSDTLNSVVSSQALGLSLPTISASSAPSQPPAAPTFVPLAHRQPRGISPIAVSGAQPRLSRSSILLPTIPAERLNSSSGSQPIPTSRPTAPLYRSRTAGSNADTAGVQPYSMSRLRQLQEIANNLEMLYRQSSETAYQSLLRERDMLRNANGEPFSLLLGANFPRQNSGQQSQAHAPQERPSASQPPASQQ